MLPIYFLFPSGSSLSLSLSITGQIQLVFVPVYRIALLSFLGLFLFWAILGVGGASFGCALFLNIYSVYPFGFGRSVSCVSLPIYKYLHICMAGCQYSLRASGSLSLDLSLRVPLHSRDA